MAENYNDLKLVVSSSPHVHSGRSTREIMLWVLVALVPAALAGVYHYGFRALAVCIVCVASSMAFEWLWDACTGSEVTVGDFSAAVTGLLLACNLPPTIPFGMAIAGCGFAIIVVKQFYGGLGCNIVNPALAGRAMMQASWPLAMTTWTLDGVSTATPLAALKAGNASSMPSLMALLTGDIGGCIGESASLALLLGFALLLYTDVIKWHMPCGYLASVALFGALFGRVVPLTELLTGGVMIGAIFMLTDYTTSPLSETGQFIYCVGCGFLTAVIRRWGGYPEGCSFSILIMNLTVPLIDLATKPHVFGAPIHRFGKKGAA